MEETLTRRPQVILIGNGLIRSFGDSPTSWTDLLENLTTEKYKGKINPNGLPNTLQIILRTEGNVNNALEEHKEELKGNPVTPELHSRIDAIRKMNPDHILTTNYSYEIECALAGQKTLSDAKIARLQRHTSEVKKCEPQYMIHSYNEAAGIPVWHIHGEARKPKSIIVGHYWYGNYGFGNYGNGIVKLIDPEEYMNGLYTWLGGRDFSKIPFMMTGFGDLYYFRNLGDGNYDIAMLDIHYRNITVPAWTIEEFISYITDEETAANILRRDLFREAAAKCGRLEADEIYYFVPALIIGGAEDIKYINKGKAAVHHQVLFQLGSH